MSSDKKDGPFNRPAPDTIGLLEQSGNTVTPPEIMGDSEAIEVDPATRERLGASDVRNESGKAVGY